MLWTSLFFICQQVFFRITPGKENFLGLRGKKALFLAGLLLGFRQGGFWDREYGTHGSLQALERRLIRFKHSGNLRAHFRDMFLSVKLSHGGEGPP